jgi:hypothetical protein
MLPDHSDRLKPIKAGSNMALLFFGPQLVDILPNSAIIPKPGKVEDMISITTEASQRWGTQ